MEGDADGDYAEFDCDITEGLAYLRAFAEEHPDVVHPELLTDDVDVSLDFAKTIVANIIVNHKRSL